MSYSLLVYINENTKFNRQDIIQAISSINNTYDISVSKEQSDDENIFGYVLSCFYRFEEEEVRVELGKDLQCIFVKDFSNAAMNFALDLQQTINVHLSVTDTDYTFVCLLSQISSIEEFENVVSQRIYMNEQ